MPYGADIALLVSDIPKLHGAACLGRSNEFDAQPPKTPDRDLAHLRAKRICLRQCPALDACRAWLDSLPPRRRPEGVVAGQFIESYIWLQDRTGRTSAKPASPAHSRQERRKHVG
jgi:hypothetical protein